MDLYQEDRKFCFLLIFFMANTMLILSLITLSMLCAVSTTSNKLPDKLCSPICISAIANCQLKHQCLDRSNLTYLVGCMGCLYNHYQHCCSCAGICPPETESEPFIKRFNVTFEPTKEKTFDVFMSKRKSEELKDYQVFNETVRKPNSNLTMSCGVFFPRKCTNVIDCEIVCSQIGFAGFRWLHTGFHEGCCQCFWTNCPDDGLEEMRCSMCNERMR